MAASKGNRLAEKHGAAAGEKALQTGEDFHGPAIVAQVEVHATYEEKGAAYMVERGAERLQAVTDLYYDAILAASQNGSTIAVLDGFVARFGWLQGKALTAWDVLRKGSKKANKAAAILEAMENE